MSGLDLAIWNYNKHINSPTFNYFPGILLKRHIQRFHRASIFPWKSCMIGFVVTFRNVIYSSIHTIQYHTILCHTIPYHTIKYHTLLYQPYHTSLHTIPYHTYHTIPYHNIPYHTSGLLWTRLYGLCHRDVCVLLGAAQYVLLLETSGFGAS